jgi:hypothetical protein
MARDYEWTGVDPSMCAFGTPCGCGFFNSGWRVATCWNNNFGTDGNANYSLCKAIKNTVLPVNILTTSNTTDLGFGSYGRNKGVRFYFNLQNDNSASGVVSFSYPISSGTSSTLISGWNCTVWQNSYTFIEFRKDLNYGYVFSSWRINNSSGTIYSTNRITSLSYNTISPVTIDSIENMWAT